MHCRKEFTHKRNPYYSTALLPLRKYDGGMMEEDALQGDPVDEVEPGRGDHPVEVMGGGAAVAGGGGEKDLEEEQEDKTRTRHKEHRRPHQRPPPYYCCDICHQMPQVPDFSQ